MLYQLQKMCFIQIYFNTKKKKTRCLRNKIKKNVIGKVTLLLSENIKNVQLDILEYIKIERDVVVGKLDVLVNIAKSFTKDVDGLVVLLNLQEKKNAE